MQHTFWLASLLVCFGLASAWADEPTVVFEDSFDGQMKEGWTWLREDPAKWRFENGALEICVEPGVAGTVKNALLRAAPDWSQGTYAIDVTVTNTTPPTNQYEQAGITWYHNDEPVFKLVKERIDGDLYIIPGRVPMSSQTVALRLIVGPDGYEARFRPEGKDEFQTVATGKLPGPGNDKVSIQCYQGPPDAEHWIRFDDFRVMKVK